MSSSRRNFFRTGTLAAAGIALGKIVNGKSFPSVQLSNSLVYCPPARPGPFLPTEESLKQYQYPEWFRDAKLGFWAHWGPQAVPRRGDWYARKMYIEGDPDYEDHLKRWGHPSKHGYKDIIPLWKAERWDPEKLMALYKKSGAKYFVSMGSHHDDFFLWNSKLHSWNAANYGPKKDVVGIWKEAAKKEGLYFGVSEHLGASFTWFQTSHGADKTGPFKDIPYDGAQPIYQDLYHAPSAPNDTRWLSNNKEWQREWLFFLLELIDNYQPDLLYSDSAFPFEEYGRTLLAHFYNTDLQKNNGKLEAIYTCKELSKGYWVDDLERGVKDSIYPFPWQTDTSLGDWFYREGEKRKSAKEVIQMLTDIVSKNGNLLINIVLTPEGDLDPDILQTVEEIGKWTVINGEGIYGSRPWKVYGEKPTGQSAVEGGNFNESKLAYTAQDIRFTTKGNILYAFCLGIPEKPVHIDSIGRKTTFNNKTISSVELMGSNERIRWRQHDDRLIIEKPENLPVQPVPVAGFRIEFKGMGEV
ncbi:MAG: alpha-L-fucosidase [Chitinophagaceae bacterium]|nr:MAG: alpha-L-fucosidase [Chitinophagaceae bacterium]